MGWISFILTLKRSSVSSSLMSEKSFLYLLLLPLFCIMFIHLFLLSVFLPCYLFCTLETQSFHGVLYFIIAARGETHLFFAIPQKVSFEVAQCWQFCAREFLAEFEDGGIDILLHLLPSNHNVTCTKHCHS